MTIYKFSEEQFETIQSALNAGIGMALRFDTQMILPRPHCLINTPPRAGEEEKTQWA